MIALCEDKRLFCDQSYRHCQDIYKLLKREVEREIRKAQNGTRVKLEKEPQVPVILDKQRNEISNLKIELERWKEYFSDKLNPPVAAVPEILSRFPKPDQELRPPPPLKS